MSNRIIKVGPYSGLTLEEVVAADPWYVSTLYKQGGNHGISNSMFNRAERLIREYGGDDEVHDPADDLYAFDGTSYIEDLGFNEPSYYNGNS